MVHRVEAYFGIEIDLYIYMPGCSNNGKQARRREKAKENAFNQISFVVSAKKKRKEMEFSTIGNMHCTLSFCCRVENFRIIDYITSFGKDDERMFCVTKRIDLKMENVVGCRKTWEKKRRKRKK